MRWRYLGAVLLVVVAVAWRVTQANVSWGPGIELLTLSAVLAAWFLPRYLTIAVPVAALIVSDAFIGNTSIQLFTLSAWAVTGIASLAIVRFRKRALAFLAVGTGFAIASTLWFYAWTNFGVWVMGEGSFQMYPHTWQGLIDCYVAGLPFLRPQLIGNALIVPCTIEVLLVVRAVWYAYAPVSWVDKRQPDAVG